MGDRIDGENECNGATDSRKGLYGEAASDDVKKNDKTKRERCERRVIHLYSAPVADQ